MLSVNLTSRFRLLLVFSPTLFLDLPLAWLPALTSVLIKPCFFTFTVCIWVLHFSPHILTRNDHNWKFGPYAPSTCLAPCPEWNSYSTRRSTLYLYLKYGGGSFGNVFLPVVQGHYLRSRKSCQKIWLSLPGSWDLFIGGLSSRTWFVFHVYYDQLFIPGILLFWHSCSPITSLCLCLISIWAETRPVSRFRLLPGLTQFQ